MMFSLMALLISQSAKVKGNPVFIGYTIRQKRNSRHSFIIEENRVGGWTGNICQKLFAHYSLAGKMPKCEKMQWTRNNRLVVSEVSLQHFLKKGNLKQVL